MRTHIKVVGWAYIIWSCINLLGAASILFTGLFGGFFSGNIGTMVIATASSAAIAIVYGFLALFGIIAGFAFLSHRPWARYVMIIAAILNLFHFPIGTLLSVYALWVLFNSETTMLFKAQERMA